MWFKVAINYQRHTCEVNKLSLTSQEFTKLFPKITEHTNDAEVSALINKLKYVSIDKDKHIIEDNHANDLLYFVIQGKLDCYIENNGTKISIGKISSGEYIGEVSMLDNNNATSSVKTETPCVFYTLHRTAFNELVKEHPTISSKILRSISSILINRLRTTDKMLFDGLIEQQSPSTILQSRKIDSTQDWFINIYNQLLH